MVNPSQGSIMRVGNVLAEKTSSVRRPFFQNVREDLRIIDELQTCGEVAEALKNEQERVARQDNEILNLKRSMGILQEFNIARQKEIEDLKKDMKILEEYKAAWDEFSKVYSSYLEDESKLGKVEDPQTSNTA
ncbi:hypothetical protein Dda_0645 [Drechslerella dactyloides]|uniref:Uncharacterized protein n=1 Tax=Drechslerella dactyloides TaxID=74499 RepID=A0AAD6J4V0_DREDA|nr:hypothetical protein Dda_0645 [Drechslerella dactyloides]